MIKLPKIFGSKLFLVLVIVILGGLLIIQYKQWVQRRTIDKEIAELQQQEKSLNQKNNELEQSLQFFASDAYKEQMARQQLGLQKTGEIAIRFPSAGDSLQKNSQVTEVKLSNPRKWWSYLFLN